MIKAEHLLECNTAEHGKAKTFSRRPYASRNILTVTDRDISVGLSAGFHFIVGGHISVEFSLTEFFDRLAG